MYNFIINIRLVEYGKDTMCSGVSDKAFRIIGTVGAGVFAVLAFLFMITAFVSMTQSGIPDWLPGVCFGGCIVSVITALCFAVICY